MTNLRDFKHLPRRIQITRLYERIEQMNAQIQAALDALQAQVAATAEVEASAVTLIQGIVVQLNDLATQVAANTIDSAAAASAITDIATALDASDDALAAAVATHTPPTP